MPNTHEPTARLISISSCAHSCCHSQTALGVTSVNAALIFEFEKLKHESSINYKVPMIMGGQALNRNLITMALIMSCKAPAPINGLPHYAMYNVMTLQLYKLNDVDVDVDII